MCKSQSGISSPKGMCITENTKSKNEQKKEKKGGRQTDRKETIWKSNGKHTKRNVSM